MLDLKRVLASKPRKPTDEPLKPLLTAWGERLTKADAAEKHAASPLLVPLDPSLHPHPQFARASCWSLDGWWEYRIVACADAAAQWRRACPPDGAYDGPIRVPFSPEALLSGVGRQLQPNELLWYRRRFEVPGGTSSPGGFPGGRVLLHFEAVDYACTCFVNGVRMGEHVGGYLPFAFDVTEALVEGGNELMLVVFDPSDAGVQLRGKQKLEHHDIWYTAQSGIWQTAWLETVPAAYMKSLEISANAETGALELDVQLCGAVGESTAVQVCVLDGSREVARASSVAADEQGIVRLRTVIDEPHLWSPSDPHLYRLDLRFGEDAAASYCAFRTVSVEADANGVPRLHLNGEPVFLRGVLDQGYWSDGLLTAPSGEALVFDIETCKALGFNMMRKHIKVESDRWYYHCDRLGMLVWQDMVSGGSPLSPWHSSYKPTFFRSSWASCRDDSPARWSAYSAGDAAYREEWLATCEGTVRHLRNHPCVVTWVLFNEAWGQFDARGATELVRKLDPTRPIDATSGWYDQACGDFHSVHNYFRPLEVYPDPAARRRPGRAEAGQRAFVISEFGGLSFAEQGHSALESSYGYGEFADLAAFREGVRAVLAQADTLEGEGLAGFVYTQLSDVEEETNGILTYDRRVNKLAEGGSSL